MTSRPEVGGACAAFTSLKGARATGATTVDAPATDVPGDEVKENASAAVRLEDPSVPIRVGNLHVHFVSRIWFYEHTTTLLNPRGQIALHKMGQSKCIIINWLSALGHYCMARDSLRNIGLLLSYTQCIYTTV